MVKNDIERAYWNLGCRSISSATDSDPANDMYNFNDLKLFLKKLLFFMRKKKKANKCIFVDSITTFSNCVKF